MRNEKQENSATEEDDKKFDNATELLYVKAFIVTLWFKFISLTILRMQGGFASKVKPWKHM